MNLGRDAMEEINMEQLKIGFAGKPFNLLVKHHLKRTKSAEKLRVAIMGTTAMLPPVARSLAVDFIDRWNERAYEEELWHMDTSEVFADIVEDARSLLLSAGAPADDETLFNMFQIVILSYAYAAVDQKSMRKSIGIQEPMSLRTTFDQAVALYVDAVKAVTIPEAHEYFSSGEYHDKKKLAKIVFGNVRSKCEMFIAMVEGLIEGSEIGFPEIERGMCFPRRFLKQTSTAALPDALRVTIDTIIEQTFFLGLMCHLFLAEYPTRADVEQVNMETLFHKWVPQALVADRHLKGYGRHLNELPTRAFESYYNRTIQPALKGQFRLGFWNRTRCESYFNNLFSSGVVLGMYFDLMTGGVDLPTL